MVGTPLAVAVGETVPHGALGQDTDQMTPLVTEPFMMVAVNCAVELGCIVAESGETVTKIGGGELVPEPQAERIAAVKYPIAIKAIRGIFLALRMATLLSQSAAHQNLRHRSGDLTPGAMRPVP